MTMELPNVLIDARLGVTKDEFHGTSFPGTFRIICTRLVVTNILVSLGNYEIKMIYQYYILKNVSLYLSA